MSLLDRHVEFVEALRSAGIPVSLAEDIDAARAATALAWGDRETIRTAYAATLVKRAGHRQPFDELFDLYFPALTGDVRPTGLDDDPEVDEAHSGPRDTGEALNTLREELADVMTSGDPEALRDLAIEALGRFGAMPGRGPGLSSWSAYQALKRVAPEELVDRIVAGLLARGDDQPTAQRRARAQVERFTRQVEQDALRRIAEEKGARHVAESTLRPTIDNLNFLSARRSDLEGMRREIQPLARRLATRLTKEQHARRRGPLDFRRTVRASISTGGVPITTHHRPKRPHRTELVVLCDVSGSVANFAQFTLLLVFALRDQFTKVRAFTFIDHVHEVTHHFKPEADVVDVMSDLAAATSHAALWGRTNYGRAFRKFTEEHADALGPRTSLLVLGDARSNYSDLELDVFRDMVDQCRRTYWLNPEHARNWGNGDSAAPTYAEIAPMLECRNIAQLGEFVHDLV
ncbi:VWA domain-containing protein [Nocardioides sp. JQ2195]|uniref:vWA domain-containing protein n=1 Tax=Nocardioides sp. JQ2195 TaxID=2592334 RepID=UPI00143EBE99|nr:VWA domain-containing protein [Nocardioides sp. JQ2195]QIX28297.1 VWA domain-containing protein [Nocardioides sp. JQ2195]